MLLSLCLLAREACLCCSTPWGIKIGGLKRNKLPTCGVIGKIYAQFLVKFVKGGLFGIDIEELF